MGNAHGRAETHSFCTDGTLCGAVCTAERQCKNPSCQRKLGKSGMRYFTPSGDTAMNISVENKYDEILKILAENNFGTNHATVDGTFPIHTAVFHNNIEALGTLIKSGADVNARNRWGLTPLHIACLKCFAPIAELLLSNGADPNGFNPEEPGPGPGPSFTIKESTPLRLAADAGSTELVKMLLDFGADPDIKDNFGHTVLHRIAGIYPKYKELASILFDKSNDYFITDSFGHTHLSWAIYFNECSLAEEMMCKMQAKYQMPLFRESIPPVLIAIYNNCWTCFRNLIKYFGDELLNTKNPSPLEFALIPESKIDMLQRDPRFNVDRNPRFSQQNAKLDRIQFAKALLEEFNCKFDDSFLLFCLGCSLKINGEGSKNEVISVCISAIGYFHEYVDDETKLKKEVLFEAAGRKGDRDLIMKLHFAGVDPNTGNIIAIHDFRKRRNLSLELVDEINELVQKPRSLVNLSVLTIRSTLHKNIAFKAKALPLPKQLCDLIVIR